MIRHLNEQTLQFLKLLGRAQFDPREPNYVSPPAFAVTDDVGFVRDVAKANMTDYNRFLKTL